MNILIVGNGFDLSHYLPISRTLDEKQVASI
jgi:hypothetical protein